MTRSAQIDEARDRALRIFRAGVRAADPALAVERSLSERPLPPGPITLVAFGKAAARMATAAMHALGAPPARALVVTNDENLAEVPGAELFAAGHPVPDARGAAAAEAVLAALNGLGGRDRVLALVSGGGSALLPAPAAGLTLADKAEVNRLLLASGADISEMNLVRQQLSRLKGGGMLRAAAPAAVTALILSDVIGDDIRAIASGPTAAPLGTRGQARATLEARGLWQALPEAVRQHLERDETAPLPPLGSADNRLVGSNRLSVEAMASEAGGTARIGSLALCGDVASAAEEVARAWHAGPGITLFGGETTVVVRGHGQGGRNQELALRLALLAERQGWPADWCYLQAGSDGRDGPTDAAGGLVDGGTAERIRAAGLDPEARLAANDSLPALDAAGDLLRTAGTGTNVADLGVFIRLS